MIKMNKIEKNYLMQALILFSFLILLCETVVAITEDECKQIGRDDTTFGCSSHKGCVPAYIPPLSAEVSCHKCGVSGAEFNKCEDYKYQTPGSPSLVYGTEQKTCTDNPCDVQLPAGCKWESGKCVYAGTGPPPTTVPSKEEQCKALVNPSDVDGTLSNCLSNGCVPAPDPLETHEIACHSCEHHGDKFSKCDSYNSENLIPYAVEDTCKADPCKVGSHGCRFESNSCFGIPSPPPPWQPKEIKVDTAWVYELKNGVTTIALFVALIMLMIMGLKYILSESPEERQEAKMGLIYVIIGLLAVVLAAAIVSNLYTWQIARYK